MTNVGQRLKKRRREVEWSQRETAERAGISPWRYFRIEKGMSPVRPEEFERLATVLGLGDDVRATA